MKLLEQDSDTSSTPPFASIVGLLAQYAELNLLRNIWKKKKNSKVCDMEPEGLRAGGAKQGGKRKQLRECGGMRIRWRSFRKETMYQKEHKINILNVFVDSTNGSAYFE